MVQESKGGIVGTTTTGTAAGTASVQYRHILQQIVTDKANPVR